MGLENFQILQQLGQGAFGTVYKVKRKLDNLVYAMKRVFVKRLSEKQKENTLNEIRILSSVDSTFIISYKEAFYDEKSQTICIVLQYADGGDLAQMIKNKHEQQAKFTEDFIWKTTYQVLRGLKKLHQGKILHRDIKPANILFSKGVAKLSDMNISKFVEDGAAITQIGTPYYRCPEVWNDEVFTEKGDIWSLGCVIYQMVALQVPFKAKMIQGLFVKVLNGVYEIPKNCPQGLVKVIKKCLMPNPSKRPTVEELLKIPEIHRFQEQHRNRTSLRISMKSTIQVPEDIKTINDILPEANYNDSLQKRIRRQNSPMKEHNKKRMNSTMKKCSSKGKLNKSLTKINKTIKIQSFKFLDMQELQPKPAKELAKSSKKIKSMKRII